MKLIELNQLISDHRLTTDDWIAAQTSGEYYAKYRITTLEVQDNQAISAWGYCKNYKIMDSYYSGTMTGKEVENWKWQ